MQDLENRLKELGDRVSVEAPSELRPTPRELRRIRVGRSLRGGAVLATVAALVFGGFVATDTLWSDAAPVPPADETNEELGIFASVAGRIVYVNEGIDRGYDRGLWAVDPSGPSDTRKGCASPMTSPRRWCD